MERYSEAEERGGFRVINMYLSLTLSEEFLSQCEDISFIIWFSGPDCDSHLKGKSKNLQYISVQIFSQILDICWIYSIQFLSLFQKYNSFWNRTKIEIFSDCFLKIATRNVKRLWEVFRVHSDLSLTMWVEFRPHCGSQCGWNVKSLWA